MIVTTDATMKTPPTERHSDFLKSLVEFTRDYRGGRWSGTLSDFLEGGFRNDPKGMVRTSHQYTWDMLRANGFDEGFSSGFADSNKGRLRCQLFEEELFGIDDTIGRVLDYFKAASAGSEVGRRLLLLLGPPSGGKASMVILLNPALEAYSQTDAGSPQRD